MYILFICLSFKFCTCTCDLFFTFSLLLSLFLLCLPLSLFLPPPPLSSFSLLPLSPLSPSLPLPLSPPFLPSPSSLPSPQVVNVKINCVRRRYKMAYIPSGFWSRLISRLMINLKRSGLVDSRSSCLSDPNMIYWRRGILIIYPSGRFLVEAIQAPLPGLYCCGNFWLHWMH